MQNKNACQGLLILLLLFSFSYATGQRSKTQDDIRTSPKLVVGIVVDQMRYDYLTKFWNHFDEGGFKRLVNDGFNCKNNHFNYAPTSTGPGHASIYSGATPSSHGVIGNNWYDKIAGESVYCASDDSYASVGTSTTAGKMSPHRMKVTTITDELRLHTQMRGKTIAIALKDRGAVLPGGHTANAAYWFNGAKEGNWISSTFYMNELPTWVADFNKSNKVEQYKKQWNTLKPIHTYIQSGADNNIYEGLFEGEKTPTFPHDLAKLWDVNGNYDILKYSPYGNNITTDFALAAIVGENLGTDLYTDFLAISYSSTDYVGHMYGVNSKEVQDMYVQLDQDIQRLLNSLDKRIGKDTYTVFLTSDHGAIHVPAYLSDQKIPADYFDYSLIKPKFDEFLNYTFGTTDIVKNFSNYQFFLDEKVIKNLEIKLAEAQDLIANEVLKYQGIDQVFTGQQMRNNQYSAGIPYILQNGYNQKNSGDVLVVLKPGVISYPKTGSTHGSPQIYDTHVPLIFYGKGIRNGSTTVPTEIPDIAPTLSVLLGVSFPNGATGTPITKVLE